MEFAEKEHIYLRNGRQYKSVSQFINEFKIPFAKGLLAEQVAKKEGKTAEEIIGKWELNADVSSTYGTALHKAIEYWILYGDVPKIKHLKDVVTKFAEKHDREIIKPEIVVYDDEYLLAGTIDQLVILGNKLVKVKDVKTNVDIRKRAYQNFLPPLQSLSDTKLNHYTLQLSIYKHLLERKGFTVTGLELEHWDGEDFETIELEPFDVTPLFKTQQIEKVETQTATIQ